MTYKFIDLFAGIGGTRIAFQRQGFECVYSNEIDDAACETYASNFNCNPKGDITRVNPNEIPDFDVLVAGFPCQAFSIAGRKLGFEDARGTLFFDLARILKDKRPASFLLENVRNLLSHDNGNTFAVIKSALDGLGYNVFYKVLNAKDYGVPQNRPRIIIVGFRKDLDIHNFDFPKPVGKKTALRDITEPDVPAHYFISEIRHRGMEAHREKHEKRGNGFGYSILDPDGVSNAIVVGGSGRERNIVHDQESFQKLSDEEKRGKCRHALRYLTVRECARLQGFPDSFVVPGAKTRGWKQFSNSVPVPMIEAVAKRIKDTMDNGDTVSIKHYIPASNKG